MTDENKIVRLPKSVPADVLVTDEDGSTKHVEYKMGEEHQALKKAREREAAAWFYANNTHDHQLTRELAGSQFDLRKTGNTLTIHAVDTEKLAAELELDLGADDEHFARQFAEWASRAAERRRNLGPALDDALDHAFPDGGAFRRESLFRELETFDSKYAKFKSGTEAAWRREKLEWPEFRELPKRPRAELDWSIQPPTTPAERNRLIWGSGLILGGVVALAIAAIVAGFKLAMG